MIPLERTKLFRCDVTHLTLPEEARRPNKTRPNCSVLGALWTNINQRSINGRYAENYREHHNDSYCRRTILIYDKWVSDPTAFGLWVLQNLGLPPSREHSLDRINNDGHYVPGNLRWANGYEQAMNRGHHDVT